ncbi:MAG: hypothetical protein BV458_12945 [Thermoplasmata archaeon M9B2D]|nr:MAG: hypothetical protein BV458_12945 [Thermoplasmata archaeon M9B2D]
MDFTLNEKEARILGCLIEKEMTTPEYYPLSLNALTNACNQKSNRNPVVSYDEQTVVQGLDNLRSKGLARETHSSSSRVPKYAHAFLDRFDLSRQEVSILCELLLRGPQTPGELRTRAGRMSPFDSLGEVMNLLTGLMEHAPPFVKRLPREPGRKEQRYAHLFSGDVVPEQSTDQTPVEISDEQGELSDRVRKLEEEVALLRSEIEEIRKSLG